MLKIPSLFVQLSIFNFPGGVKQIKQIGLALFCPITSHVKGYPSEVVLPEKHKVSGAILSDQVKSLDWQVRKAKRIANAPNDVLEDVMAKIFTILGFEFNSGLAER